MTRTEPFTHASLTISSSKHSISVLSYVIVRINRPVVRFHLLEAKLFGHSTRAISSTKGELAKKLVALFLIGAGIPGIH